ncbi:3-isopropylmalate dehydrogenase [Lewinellaceae bacterium SD302]|nr:3-isopropylmalate dehydrogenase [Lewinellaceae bacterium SD302]
MSIIKLAVLDGDGIGPEVVKQAIKVLNAVGQKFGHDFSYDYAPVGATAIDQTGEPLPDTTLELCKKSDAVLFGAIGHPRYDNDPSAKVRPEQGLLKLRRELGLYANLRPVAAYEELLHLSPLQTDRIKGVDMLIVRELTGGIYFGERGRSEDGNSAFDTCSYSRMEIERICKIAFREAAARRKKLHLVDKANVLESSRLWREVVRKMASEHPEIEVQYMFVDNAAMQLVLNPAQFDVIVTSNMFGDILSDTSSVLAGSLGLLPSSSIGSSVGMFEPIHGSAPDLVGQNKANPVATILSAAMLLDHLDLRDEAAAIRRAVNTTLASGVGTGDLRPEKKVGCTEMGDLIAGRV